MKSKKSGIWIVTGATALLIELILIQLHIVSLELPDHKADIPSLLLAIVSWASFFMGLGSILNESTFVHVKKSLYVSLTGLGFYTFGCVFMLLEYWDLILVVPAGLFLTALGMMITGVIVIRRKIISGWRRFAFLAVGLYPFLLMFPTVVLTGAPNYSVNYFWGLLWLWLGSALYFHQKKQTNGNRKQPAFSQ